MNITIFIAGFLVGVAALAYLAASLPRDDMGDPLSELWPE